VDVSFAELSKFLVDKKFPRHGHVGFHFSVRPFAAKQQEPSPKEILSEQLGLWRLANTKTRASPEDFALLKFPT
jgi:hypothetical protein